MTAIVASWAVVSTVLMIVFAVLLDMAEARYRRLNDYFALYAATADERFAAHQAGRKDACGAPISEAEREAGRLQDGSPL